MGKKQYNNIIEHTLKHEKANDSLETARAIFKNMGVALPQGDVKEVSDILKTNNYMAWRVCDSTEAQKAADRGIAAIGIDEEKIIVLSANDEEQPVEQTASVMTLSNDIDVANDVSTMQYYVYSNVATEDNTPVGGGITTEDNTPVDGGITTEDNTPVGGGITTEDNTPVGGGVTTQDYLYFEKSELSVVLGWNGYNNLYGSTLSTIYWTSSASNVAWIDKYTGYIMTLKPGIVTITACCSVDSTVFATFELWIRGKTPVFLIHGRTSNSFETWGAGNMIFTNILDTDNKDNDHFDSSINALSIGNSRALYISKSVQDIVGYNSGVSIEKDGENVDNFEVEGVFNGKLKDGKYTSIHPEGGNLAYYLKLNGYTENINLFVFNYPNEDAVIHSAKKFEKYIENLIDFVRTAGSNEMKACFYKSRLDYEEEKHKINLVGHSMGGLVSRYCIENLNMDNHIEKLITICTPHWGSGLADASNLTSIQHVLCDHDLDIDSEMFGGNSRNSFDENGCGIINSNQCVDHSYEITDELQYSSTRNTLYYAIAGIVYDSSGLSERSIPIELLQECSTYEDLSRTIHLKIYDYLHSINADADMSGIYIDIYLSGDNVVNFLSQIGWTDDLSEMPLKKLDFEKVYINVDINKNNSITNHLHSKMTHRETIMEKVKEYLD